MKMFRKTLAALLVLAATGTVAHAGHTVTGDGAVATADITVQEDAGITNTLTKAGPLTAGTIANNQVVATGSVASKSNTDHQYEIRLDGGSMGGTTTIDGKQARVVGFTAQNSSGDDTAWLNVAIVADDMDISKAVDTQKGTVINASEAAPSADYKIVTAAIEGHDTQTVKSGTYTIKTTAYSWNE
ncbi:TPA: hypothetical protein U2R15_004166 [Klebsiella aerogenes]|nr:hypothetical protein [Klebsiella aerogenes]